MKQPLVFVKCALCNLKYDHVIDSEASDLLRVMCLSNTIITCIVIALSFPML